MEEYNYAVTNQRVSQKTTYQECCNSRHLLVSIFQETHSPIPSLGLELLFLDLRFILQ